jgi:hypothetical protein
MQLISLASFLSFPTQPFSFAQRLILPGALQLFLVIPSFDTRKLIVIEADFQSSLSTTLPYFTIGICIAALAAFKTYKPGVFFAEKCQSFSKLVIVEFPDNVRHPVLISLGIHPFGQKQNKVSEFRISAPSGTASAIKTAISD